MTLEFRFRRHMPPPAFKDLCSGWPRFAEALLAFRYVGSRVRTFKLRVLNLPETSPSIACSAPTQRTAQFFVEQDSCTMEDRLLSGTWPSGVSLHYKNLSLD